jgi:hypothetical protein
MGASVAFQYHRTGTWRFLTLGINIMMDDDDFQRIEQGDPDSCYGIFPSILLVLVAFLWW